MTSAALGTTASPDLPDLPEQPVGEALVGNAAARATHGLSAGADVALLAAAVPSASSALADVLTRLGAGTASAVEALTELADLASTSHDAPLVVAAADLEISIPAVLDLLDKPGVGTAALTVSPDVVSIGLARLPAVRVGADGRLLEAVGTGPWQVSAPNRALPGLLRVAAEDRARAARAWRAAAPSADPVALAASAPADPFGVAVLVLVRAGIPVQAAPLGPFSWSREDVAGQGAAGGPWQQRLRGASRGGDGLVSTLMTRRMSRPLTGFGLARGWSPNVVTVASLSAGIAAAVLIATGQRWAWVLAAALLQTALVVDCVDGEIARFTRRFSAFGAWLDAVGDRVKEYAVCAALAAVAVRQGTEGWVLAIAAMALVSMRHLEDFPYADRLRPTRSSRPDVRPLADLRADLGADVRTTYAAPLTTAQRALQAVKQVLHLPIAERYVLICVSLLTFRPRLVLWVLIVAVLAAAAYTQGGRVVKAVRHSDGWLVPAAPVSARGHRTWGFLDHQLDLGPIARATGRRLRLPLAVAPLGVVLLGGAVLLDTLLRHTSQRPGAAASPQIHTLAASAAVVLAVVGAVLLGASTRPPLRHRLAWQLPVALWLAEALVICGAAVACLPQDRRGPGFAFAAAVAYHRYDLVYRLRDTGTPPAAWLTLFGLGCDGRIVVLLAVVAWAPGSLGVVLSVGAAYLAVLYLTESALGWRRLAGRHAAALAPDSPAAGLPA